MPKWCFCQVFLNFAGYTDIFLLCDLVNNRAQWERGKLVLPRGKSSSSLSPTNSSNVLGQTPSELFRIMVTRKHYHSVCFMPWQGLSACRFRSDFIRACPADSRPLELNPHIRYDKFVHLKTMMTDLWKAVLPIASFY